MYGQLFFKKKKGKSKVMGNSNNKKRKCKRDMFDFNYTKSTLRKQRSSQLISNYLQNTLKESMKIAKSKQTTKASSKSRKRKSTREIKTKDRTKSLDEWTFITNVLKETLRPRNSIIRKSGKRSASIIENNKK